MKRQAFTLVEVMISIAIALVLVIGISQIFAIAQRTTGSGNAVISALQDDRSVQHTLTKDFRTMVNGSAAPAMVIYSGPITAWRSIPTKNDDADGQISTLNPLPGSNTNTRLFYTQTNEQIHRVDRVCFFDRDKFIRQTSTAPNLTSSTSSDEAFVWLGHLALPNNSTLSGTPSPWQPNTPQGGAWRNPGQPAPTPNDNNLYASTWILGREVILMLPQPPNNEPNYYPGPPNTNNDPFSLVTSQAGGVPLWASRYDLAATSVDQYRVYLNTLYQNTVPAAGNAPAWTGWQGLIGYNSSNPSLFNDPRYAGNPFPLKPTSPSFTTPNPVGEMSAAIAQTYPLFVRGCTQFIVEFAGDFVTQDSTSGQVTSAAPDGQIDFTVDPDTGAHKIRWYGFPRDPDNEGKIGVSAQPVSGKFTTAYNVQYGVCPLRDTARQASDFSTVYSNNNYPTRIEFERVVPTLRTNYSTANTMRAADGTSTTPYIVAWGPDTTTRPQPKMIRITIAIDDPDSRLSTSQFYEYVFTLP